MLLNLRCLSAQTGATPYCSPADMVSHSPARMMGVATSREREMLELQMAVSEEMQQYEAVRRQCEIEREVSLCHACCMLSQGRRLVRDEGQSI